MIVYVGAGSGPFRDHLERLGHGQLMNRLRFAGCSERTIPRGSWVFDNGAWKDFIDNQTFGWEQFWWCMDKLRQLPEERWPEWCTCPDTVGDPGSLNMSLEWLQRLPPEFRWYFAVQNGMDEDRVEYWLDEFSGIFVGGTREWKLATAPRWVELAHQHGKQCHIGRVNGPRWLQWAIDIGADSVDGNGWVRAGRKWLPALEACAPVPLVTHIQMDLFSDDVPLVAA